MKQSELNKIIKEELLGVMKELGMDPSNMVNEDGGSFELSITLTDSGEVSHVEISDSDNGVTANKEYADTNLAIDSIIKYLLVLKKGGEPKL